jgi:hypothetical protein
MSTVGNIVAVFSSDTKGLKKGVDSAITYFEKLQDQIDDITDSFEEFSENIKKQTKAAQESVEALGKSSKVVLDVDSSGAMKGIDTLKTAVENIKPPKLDVISAAAPAAIKAVAEASGKAAEATHEAEESAHKFSLSLSQVVIQSARAVTFASTTIGAYRSLRASLLGNIQAITGAESATKAYVTVQRALRGEAEAIGTVLGAAKATLMQYGSSLFSADGAYQAINAGMGVFLKSIGVSDAALRDSISVLSESVLRRAASAATITTESKALGILSKSYDDAVVRTAKWLEGNKLLARASAATGDAIHFIARTVNGQIRRADEVMEKFFRRFIGRPVASATAEGFDRLASAVSRVYQNASAANGPIGKLTTVVSETGREALAMIPSFSQARAAVATFAERVGPVVRILGGLRESLNFVSQAHREAAEAMEHGGHSAHIAAEGFWNLIGSMVRTQALVGAIVGGIGALAGGTSVMGGAIAGAASALTSLAAVFPLAIAGGAAAAVATGAFAHELEELSVAFQRTDQMASRFGATTAEMQKLETAAANTMVSMGQLGKAQQSFFTNLSKIRGGQMNVESVREAKLAFDRLGISVENIKNQNPRETFAQVAEAVGAIEDPADRTAAAFDLFGRQGAAIVPALKEFGELEKDFARVGGATPKVDVKRWLDLETSFDRLKASSQSLATNMLLPFVEIQKGMNNFRAELLGGLVPVFGVLGSMFADMTKPIASVLEVAGRLVNIMGRIVGVFASFASSLGMMATIAAVFEGIKEGALAVLAPIEDMISAAEEIAGAFADFMAPATDGLMVIFGGLGAVVGAILAVAAVTTAMAVGGAAAWAIYTAGVSMTTAIVNVCTLAHLRLAASYLVLAAGVAAVTALTAAAVVVWGVYTAATAVAAAVANSAAVSFAIAWLAALGPLGAAIVLIGAVAGAMYVLFTYAAPLTKLFRSIGEAMGFVGEEAEKFDAAKASVQELADEAARAGSGDVHQLAESLKDSRSELDELVISSSKFGQAGADAASQAQKQYAKLEQKLAEGKITADEFDAAVAKNAKTFEENLKSYKDDSPEITLKKNLELYKSLDESIKSAGKSVRDLAAGSVVNKTLFPTSEAIKESADTFKNEYAAAIEEIKRKQQSGGFAKELADQAKQLEEELASGAISSGEYNTRKLGLDSTSAGEEAQKAAEEVKRTFDRQMDLIGKDVSFASDIRKQLEDAFLSPVDKFEKRLKEINDNKSLTPEEKALAEKNLRKEGREQIIGKTASEKFQDRQRDLLQANQAGLISPGEMAAEMAKNSTEIANSLGAVVNPARGMETTLFGLDEALKAGAINADDWASGVKNAKDKFLESLGIDKTASQKDNERLAELQRQFDNGKIDQGQFDRGKLSIGNEVFGKSQAQNFADQEDRIRNAIAAGADQGRGGAALRKLSMDKLGAVGLEASPAAKLQAQVDKIDDAFGIVGLDAKAAAAKLRQVPGATEAYRRSIEKANKSIIDSYGVNKTPMEAFSSGLDGIRDKFGITGKTIEESRSQLRGNTQALALFDRAVNDARDGMLKTFGIEKSPMQAFEEQMKKIDEAASAPDGLTPQEAAKARAEAAKKRDEALGGDSVNGFFNEYAKKKSAIEEAYGKNGEKDKEKFASAMLNLNKGVPGLEKGNPIVEFQRNLDKLGAIFGTNSKEFKEGKLNLQAQLQEELRPMADRLAPDRRGVESADIRSKAGVDTFFRILRGRDNPSLKAQVDTARNTKILADAANNQNARPLLVQLQPH